MEFEELLTGYRNRKFSAKLPGPKVSASEQDTVALPHSSKGSDRKTLRKHCLASLSLLGPLLLFLSLAISATAQQRLALVPADILRYANVGDAQISPGGDAVVYTVSTVEGDTTRSTLWLANTTFERRIGLRPEATEIRPDFDQLRQPPTRLLPGGWYATNPRWSTDGKSIAFFSEHESLKGIWLVTLDRRSPRFIVAIQDTNFFITYAGEPFAWSPDSRIIAYISASDDSATIESEHPNDPRVIDRIQYKSRTSFADHLRTHVYFTYVDNPEPRQLTTGSYYDHALSFSPRGDEVAFLSNHEADPDANNNSDIFAVDLHGQVRQITNTKGCEYEPAWSPDGKWIAYTATKRDVTTIDSIAEDTHLWIIDASSGGGRELGTGQDLRARAPRWSTDSKWVYYLANDHGCTTIFRGGTEGHQLERFSIVVLDGRLTSAFVADSRAVAGAPGTQTFQLTGFSLPARNGTSEPVRRSEPFFTSLAFTLADPAHPADLWLSVGNGRPLRRLSQSNEGFLRSSSVVLPEEMNFRSFDGTRIQGWLLKPADWRPDRKYPLILSIHGGPHGMFGWAFNPTFQIYADRGYAVLYLNPRGSSGYGQKFADGTLNEWGGGDYKDLMLGVDEALRRFSWIDQERMGVTGGSYGGFMTNWIITQTPRFKAAVSVASVSNLISFYATSLYQDLIHAEFGFPWDNYDLLWQWSPLRYAKQVQTPTLFIHGEQDNDVHITQAEEIYMALRRRGVDTVLVRYPREGHGLREPRHRVDALERTLAWFDRYLK